MTVLYCKVKDMTLDR